MERWRGKVIVLTGASSGIGLSVARLLLKHDMIVVGLSRRQDVMMKEMENEPNVKNFHAIQCDVASEDSVKKAFEIIRDRFDSIQVLVNNAGLWYFDSTLDVESSALKNLVDVNIMGYVYCYKEAVPLLRKDDQEALIFNMSSISGHTTMPGKLNAPYTSNIYPATKHAVTVMSDAWGKELASTNIRVTNLSPGYIETNLNAAIHDFAKEFPRLKPSDVGECIILIMNLPSHIRISQMTIKAKGEIF